MSAAPHQQHRFPSLDLFPCFPQVVGFTTKLFDLNQDGRTTVDEMLTSLALDSVVSDDAIDESAVKVRV